MSRAMMPDHDITLGSMPAPSLIKMFGIPARWAGALLSATVLLICVAFVVLLANARTADRAKASVAASNLSAALTQDIGRNLELYDLSLQAVIDGIAKPEVMAADPAIRQMILFDRSTTAPYLGSIVVTNEAGDITLDSTSVSPRTLNFADRAYFKAQASRANLGLFISEPFRARSDGAWVINLSRRINKPDGSFGGVVAGTLRIAYLQDLFSRMKLGEGGSLTLFRTDGTLMMREPFNEALLGRVIKPPVLFDSVATAPEGEYEAVSAVDGVSRLYHYHRVGSFPLVQNVAMATRDIYADWWRKTLAVSAILLAACLIIGVLGLCLGSELRQRVRAEASLIALASEDPLTKLANRRRFDQTLDTEMKRAVTHGLPLALLMVDVDHFKAYNDAFGHPAGDTALVAIAGCLMTHAARASALAARYGGEEFALILPHTGPSEAHDLAEAIRQGVAALPLGDPASADRPLSVSIGLVSLTPGMSDTAARVIEMADQALYTAKAQGRNRSMMFGGHTAPMPQARHITRA